MDSFSSSSRWLRYSVLLSLVVCLQTAMANLLVAAAPFMTKEFLYLRDDGGSGFYAGFLISAFYLGRSMTTTSPWGSIADSIGRKIVLYIALVATGLLTIAVGLVRNFWLAVALRWITGCFSPTLSLARALSLDITPKSRHSSVMSHISAGRTLGFLMGPTLGGWLSYPCKEGKYGALTLRKLFPSFCGGSLPFAPACIFCGLLQVVALAAVYLVPESPAFAPPVSSLENDNSTVRPFTSSSQEPRPSNKNDDESRKRCLFGACFPCSQTRLEPLQINSTLLCAIAVAFCISFARIASDQTVALLCVEILKFSSEKVGSVFFFSGLINFPLQLFFVPWALDRYQPYATRAAGTIIAAIVCALYPSIASSHVPLHLSVFLVSAALAIKDLAFGGLGHTSNFLIVNGCPKTTRARVNGFLIQAQSIASTLSPVFGTTLFALGLKASMSQQHLTGLTKFVGVLSYGLPFYVCALISTMTFALCCISMAVEKRKQASQTRIVVSTPKPSMVDTSSNYNR